MSDLGKKDCPVSACMTIELPLAITALAVLILAGIFASLAWTDAGVLQQARANQEQALTQLTDLRGKLDRLAIGTRKLAEGGNANAKDLVDRLQKAGVTIKEPAAEEAPK